jgi:hypothetical protein
LNVPRFILPEVFDARTDGVVYDFTIKDSFLEKTKRILNTKEWKEKINDADKLFDIVAFLIFLFHVTISFVGVYYEILPWYLFAILFTMTRTSLAGVGHYHCHRKKNGIADWGDCFFDF